MVAAASRTLRLSTLLGPVRRSVGPGSRDSIRPGSDHRRCICGAHRAPLSRGGTVQVRARSVPDAQYRSQGKFRALERQTWQNRPDLLGLSLESGSNQAPLLGTLTRLTNDSPVEVTPALPPGTAGVFYTNTRKIAKSLCDPSRSAAIFLHAPREPCRVGGVGV